MFYKMLIEVMSRNVFVFFAWERITFYLDVKSNQKHQAENTQAYITRKWESKYEATFLPKGSQSVAWI